MAIKLNLLPPEYAVRGPIGDLLKAAKSLTVILVALFVVFTIGVSAFFVISNLTLNDLNAGNDALKSQIKAMETTETQVVILKDRIAKIKKVQSSPSAVKNLVAVDSFLSGFGGSYSIGELNVDSQKVDTSISLVSNNDLSAFIKNLTDSKNFSSVLMTSFGFAPSTGYLVGVRLEGK